VQDLTEFLIKDSISQQAENLNATQLIVCGNEIIGFVTLLADNLNVKKIDDETKRLIKKQIPHIKKVPSIKIGRFAIDNKYANQGLGTMIMEQLIFEIATDISLKVGIRFIIVDGYAKAYNFYKNTNFILLDNNKKELNKLDKAKKQNPYQTFGLYQDIIKLKIN